MKKGLLLFLLCFTLFADSDEQIFSVLSETFKGKLGDSYKRTVKRIGDKTILFEALISIEADPKIMPIILADVGKYNDWALTNINKAPGSNLNYFLKIYRFIVDPKEPHSVRPEYLIDLPGFREVSTRRFDYKTEQKGQIFTLTVETPEDHKSHIEKAACQLKMFPSPQSNRVWLYVTSKLKIRYWLLYEALPTRLLEKESMERVQIVLDNYQTQEDKWKTAHGAKK